MLSALLSLFKPWLLGWRHRFWHAVVLRHKPGTFTEEGPYGRWARAHCSCGDTWLESWAL